MPAGKPRKYKTAAELDAAVAKYLETGETVVFGYDRDGNPFERDKIYTITGLTLFLGFASRQSLLDVSKLSPEYSDVVRRAKLAVSLSYEKLLAGGSKTAQFALQNIDRWTFKTTTETITPNAIKRVAELAAQYVPDEQRDEFGAQVREILRDEGI